MKLSGAQSQREVARELGDLRSPSGWNPRSRASASVRADTN